MTQLSYSLIDNPWIPVRYSNNTVKEVSLNTLFKDLTEIREIVGDNATQTVALFRLLLAIALSAQRSAVLEESASPVFTMMKWIALWSSPGQLGEDVIRYLKTWSDRFDLFSKEYPFMQVGDLSATAGTIFPISKIIVDIPDNNPLFTTRWLSEGEGIGFNEAARWLVHVHAYDTAGNKSAAKGDFRYVDGKGTGIGLAWLGQIGLMFVECRNLAETLLMNMIPNDQYNKVELKEIDWEKDIPCWERGSYKATSRGAVDLGSIRENREYEPLVNGPVDLMTWQARRVRLHAQEGKVVGVTLAQGDRISSFNRYLIEPMTTWRFSGPDGKRPSGYVAKPHEPSEFFWQGLPATLGQMTGMKPVFNAQGVPEYRSGALIRWMGLLHRAGIISQKQLIPVRAIGMKYHQKSKVTEVFDDRLLLPVSLLIDDAGRARTHLRIALQATVEVAEALGSFAINALEASGKKYSSDPRQRAAQRRSDKRREIESVYFMLDESFRRWIAQLTSDKHDHLKSWRSELERIITVRRLEILRPVGTHAFIGSSRQPTLNENPNREARLEDRWIDLGIADREFRKSTDKHLNSLYRRDGNNAAY